VPSDRRGSRCCAVSWLLVGRGTAVFGDRHRALVRNARAFGPGGQWTGGGAGCPPIVVIVLGACVIVVGGLQPGRSTYSASRASAQRGVFPGRME
jgi:hypothetical protein